MRPILFLRLILFLQLILIVIGTSAQENDFLSNPDEKLFLRFRFAQEQVQNFDKEVDIPSVINFKEYDGGDIPVEADHLPKIYIFQSRFFLDKNLHNNDLSLYTGTIDFPTDVYLNHHKIGRMGSYKERYTSQLHFAHEFLLPSEMLFYGNDSINELILMAYPRYNENRRLDKMFISSFENVSQWNFRRTFISVHLVRVSIIFTIILSIYFFFGHFLKRDRTDFKYLVFAFFCLFFSMAYMNIAFSYDLSSQFIYLKFTRVGMVFANLFLLIYTLVFTKAFSKNIWLKPALFVLPIVVTIVMLMQNNIADFEKIFNLFAGLINLPYMLFGFVITIIAVIKYPDKHKIAYALGFVYIN